MVRHVPVKRDDAGSTPAPTAKCSNGCDAPIHPPSRVICKACLDKITATFEQILKDWPEP